MLEMDCNLKHQANVFMFLSCFLVKSPKKLTMVCSLFEKIIRFLSLDVLGAFREQQKVFNLTSANFSTNNVKNPRDVVTLKTSYTHSEIVKIFSTFKYGVCKTLKATLRICFNRNNYKLRGNTRTCPTCIAS